MSTEDSGRYALVAPLKPRAWLCEFAQEDGTIRTQIVEQDPAGLRWNDAGEPSPFRVVPLYEVDTVQAQVLTSAEADFEAMTWTFAFPPGTRIGAGEYAVAWMGPSSRDRA